ncbi:MAG: entericidin A/B family lipoprotein [Phycisphaerales bacterium]|nr:entericidin A/B family lipoprotein [Phycisphaerales bacterium]
MTKRIILNRVLTVLVLGGVSGLASFTMSGCNTVEGVGRDVESAGDAIADTARDAKD